MCTQPTTQTVRSCALLSHPQVGSCALTPSFSRSRRRRSRRGCPKRASFKPYGTSLLAAEVSRQEVGLADARGDASFQKDERWMHALRSAAPLPPKSSFGDRRPTGEHAGELPHLPPHRRPLPPSLNALPLCLTGALIPSSSSFPSPSSLVDVQETSFVVLWRHLHREEITLKGS